MSGESFSAIEEAANDAFVRVHDLSSMPPALRRLPRSDIARIEPLPGSPMPPSTDLSAPESLDLVFFLRSGGAPSDRRDIASRPVNLWSEGTRLSGTLFHPKELAAGEKLPAIVMSPGWEGLAQHLEEAYAPYFAAEGFAVLTFDYRGWGRSDGRRLANGEEVREVVDPRDQTEDIVNAIDFVEGEEIVDRARIGYWGTSYSGGHAVWIAAHDPRVRAVVALAPVTDFVGAAPSGAIRRSRVEDYSPRADAHLVNARILILTHHQIYERKRAEAIAMAIAWFREYLRD
jgi:dienelactone hydrolase